MTRDAVLVLFIIFIAGGISDANAWNGKRDLADVPLAITWDQLRAHGCRQHPLFGLEQCKGLPKNFDARLTAKEPKRVISISVGLCTTEPALDVHRKVAEAFDVPYRPPYLQKEEMDKPSKQKEVKWTLDSKTELSLRSTVGCYVLELSDAEIDNADKPAQGPVPLPKF